MLNGFGDCVEMGKNNWSVHSVSMVSSWYYCEEVLPSRSCDKSTTVDTFMQMGIKHRGFLESARLKKYYAN